MASGTGAAGKVVGIVLIVVSVGMLALGAWYASWFMTLGWGYALLAAGVVTGMAGIVLMWRGRRPSLHPR